MREQNQGNAMFQQGQIPQQGQAPQSPQIPRQTAPPMAGQPAVQGMQRYCRNCGSKIDAGASVCVHCNSILNPVAVRNAQQMVLDRKAVVTKGMLVKSFLWPFSGWRMYKKLRLQRPQVAAPCRKAAWLGAAAWAVVIALIILL